MPHTPRPRWTKAMEIRLVELYEENPCLWNPRLISQLKAGDREDIYRTIALQLGDEVTGEDVRYKIKYNRDYFNRENKKVMATKLTASSAQDVYQPSWHLFNSLKFLDLQPSESGLGDHIDFVNSDSHTDQVSDDLVDEYKDMSPKLESPKIEIIHDETNDSGLLPSSSFDLQHHHHHHHQHQNYSVIVPTSNHTEHQHREGHSSRKRPKSSADTPVVDSITHSVRHHIMQQQQQQHSMASSPTTPTNSSCTFGHYVGERLDAFDEEQRNWAMFKISEVLFKASRREFDL